MTAPRGVESAYLLLHRDEPIALADHAARAALDPAIARREMETALAANDPELAHSFLDLARAHGVAVEPALAERVAAANDPAALAVNAAGSFAHGLVVGEPQDAAGLAGMALGDLFIYGDIRDALREGSRLLVGEEADELVLGLACVGLAVTAGVYASAGAAAPARVGVSLVKGARKAGHIGFGLSAAIGRSLRGAVDLAAVRRAASQASALQPAAAARALREAVKLDEAAGLVRLLEDAGRVQAKAGSRAALDGLKIAQSPADMARVAKLAEAKGGKTRAILKLGGRAAVALTVASYKLASWAFSALLSVIGFLAAAKGLTERLTRRAMARRSRRPARGPRGASARAAA